MSVLIEVLMSMGVVDGAEGETTHSTCAGGGAGLTSLRKGRRHTAVCRRCPRAPAVVDIRPHTSVVKWGGAGSPLKTRRVPAGTYKGGDRQ